ncbi:hypothetical protein AB4Z55_03205 [Gordonia sp. ABKF26]|uniref:hypothetical protein n=1 Tax=Gordonia sp. ABKF26 TaxID=3238687 RepID=UPI0034E5CDFD
MTTDTMSATPTVGRPTSLLWRSGSAPRFSCRWGRPHVQMSSLISSSRSAARLPRLDVLLDKSAEFDLDLATDLALAGRGRCRTADTYRDVAPALISIFE